MRVSLFDWMILTAVNSKIYLKLTFKYLYLKLFYNETSSELFNREKTELFNRENYHKNCTHKNANPYPSQSILTKFTISLLNRVSKENSTKADNLVQDGMPL